jgi:hypothetical protein
LVLKHCLDDLAEVGAMGPQGWIDLPASEVRDAIARTARYLGASSPHARRLSEMQNCGR